MSYLKSISGTFTNVNIINGVLTLNYAQDVDRPLSFVVHNNTYSATTETYAVTKLTVNSCSVNVGEQYRTGTWRYRLLYTND
jgi:hypothetical protein